MNPVSFPVFCLRRLMVVVVIIVAIGLICFAADPRVVCGGF